MSSTNVTPASESERAPAQAKNEPKLNVPRRAHTYQSGTDTDRTSPFNAAQSESDQTDAYEATDEDPADAGRTSVDMGELPIELVSLTDSFIESLSAKVHPTPPNIDTLSNLFQDFYAVASTHINTHVSALASKQMRENSPSSARGSPGKQRGKAKSLSSKDTPENAETEQRMLTPQELADRRRARKALEQKRARLEEAVERRLCEGIYARIYRHRSTQDEALDAKLRSKTAALNLVGINLSDLGVDLGETSTSIPENEAGVPSRPDEIKEALEPARKEFALMSEKRYPLGKLNHLKAIHRIIVDVLSHYRPSASADEIMPMMIFTLVTLPPEGLHAISDVRFIQNFRWEQKLNGEAAYCLTTLEAALSFLQTVDLSTLRADELPSGPPKAPSQPNTPRAETFPPAYGSALGPEATPGADAKAGTKPPPSPGSLRVAVQRNRRLSDLVNTPAQAINAASDSILTTADQSIKTISNSLGDSYNFLLGKLRERQDAPQAGSLVVPKTLDDARKLVSTPPPEDDASVSGASDQQIPEEETGPQRSTPEDRILAFIGGRKPPRDRSAEGSSRSASRASSKRAASVLGMGEDGKEKQTGGAAGGVNPLESMRNLGSSLNPMARLSGMSMIRGFGRTASGAQGKEGSKGPAEGGDLATAFPDIAPALPPKEQPKIAPPVKRFMEMQNPGDLKLSEVLELLRDYRRLANALKDAGAFEAK